MFVNSIALKTQFTSKWTKSDIVKENFPITQVQSVMVMLCYIMYSIFKIDS